MANSIFTYRHNTEGKVGIGNIPFELNSVLDDISSEYINIVPDKSKTTFHTYYTELFGRLKTNFDLIQFHSIWDNICDQTNNCIKKIVFEMNEIYYSNIKPNFTNMNLYGAAANLIPHKDCILFKFDGINMYRVIIGLTENNNDTVTEFVNLKLEHKINKGNYMIFDFDRTLHQVKKVAQQETQRILLKIHFIVCENCRYSEKYVDFVSVFYKIYYYIARYTEQKGTDPTTFVGFFFGLLWEWPFYNSFRYTFVSLYVSNIFILNVFYKIKFEIKNIGKLVYYSSLNMFVIYLSFVLFYYFRYILFDIR